MEKVKYKCLGCGWSKEIPKDWGDVKPKYCPTPTCEMSVKKSKGRKSYRNNPDMLQVTYSTSPAPEKKEVVKESAEYEVKEQLSGTQRRQQQSQRNRAANQSGTVSSEAPSDQENRTAE